MRSLLLLAVLVTASQAFMVPQIAPCSGSSVCLINCQLDSRCPVFNLAKPVYLVGTSCSRFFKCEAGRACEMECPAGLHFKQDTESCDWPHQACCDATIECRPEKFDDPVPPPILVPPCGSPAVPAPPGEPPIPVPPCGEPPADPSPPAPVDPQPPIAVPPCNNGSICLVNCVLDPRCPSFNPIKPILLPGPTCERFYKCESGRACEMKCPTGTHFNPREQACDWPNQACCDPSIECRPDTKPPQPIWPPPSQPIWPPPSQPIWPPPSQPIWPPPSQPIWPPPSQPIWPPPSQPIYPPPPPPRPPPPPPAPIWPPPSQPIWPPPSQPIWPPPSQPIWPPPSQPHPPTGLNCPPDNRCPSVNGKTPLFLPGASCDRYLKCESGRACPMNCPVGLHFNVNKQTCDWPAQACCDPRIECRPNSCPPGAFGCSQSNNNWFWG